jgi:hypothetical protein
MRTACVPLPEPGGPIKTRFATDLPRESPAYFIGE